MENANKKEIIPRLLINLFFASMILLRQILIYLIAIDLDWLTQDTW
jgi:hypothetical protein